MYEVFEHTADIGLRVRAADLNALFADAAHGLFSLLVANPEAVQCVEEREFHVGGDERDYLLFDWLSELLYTFETERLLLAHFDVRVRDDGLDAVCRGEPIDRQRHQMDHEIKAITYHELKLVHEDSDWVAEVIVDI